MKFSVIYSVNIPKPEPFTHTYTVKMATIAPPKFKRGTWAKTENNNSIGADEGYNHAKWAAILDKAQFCEFVRHCELTADDVETMGSIGAPGFGFGWAPAISFDYHGPEYSGNAYVTPLPTKRNRDPIRKNGATERDWERLKARIVKAFK